MSLSAFGSCGWIWMFVIMWKNCMRAASHGYAFTKSDQAPAHAYVWLLMLEVNVPVLDHPGDVEGSGCTGGPTVTEPMFGL